MTEDIYAILFWANILSEARYVRTLFQSCIISFYIENTRQFCCFTYLHYKQQSHGKELSVPRYLTLALGSEFHLETRVKRTSFKLSFKDS